MRFRQIRRVALGGLLTLGCEASPPSVGPDDALPAGTLGAAELGASHGGGRAGLAGGLGPGGAFVDARVRTAEAMIVEERYEEALATMNEAIAERPEHGQFHYVRGNALGHLDRDKDALIAYAKAIELDDRDFRAHGAVATMTAHGLGDLEGSIESFQRALKIEPGFGVGHYGLGVVLLQLGRSEAALEALENAYSLMGSSPDVLFALSRAKAQNGDLDGAADAGRKSVDLEPGPEGVDLRLAYARILSARGDNQLAAEQLEKTAALAPKNAALQIEVVRALLDIDRASLALPIVETLAISHPKEIAVLINHGRVLAALGRLDGRDGALARFEVARAAKPGVHGAHHYAVKALVRANRCSAAKKALAVFKRTRPPEPQLTKTRALLRGC